MADNLNQKIELDASQFIAATQSVATAAASLDKSFDQIGAVLTAFNKASQSVDIQLNRMVTSLNATAAASQGTLHAVNGLQLNMDTMNATLNRISLNTQRVGDLLSELGNKATSASNRMSDGGVRVLLSWQSIERLLVVTVIRRAFLELISLMNQATLASIDFQNKLGLIAGVANNTGTSINNLSQRLSSISTRFNQPLAQVTEGSLEAFRVGMVHTEEDFSVFNSEMARLAQITGQQVNQVLPAAAATMRGFGLAAGETTRVVNLFNFAWRNGINQADIEGTFGRMSATAKDLGVSIEELTGMLVFLRQRGLSSAEAATQLTQIMRALHDPTSQLTQVLRDNSFETARQALQQRGLAGVLRLVAAAAADQQSPMNQLIHSRRVLADLSGGGLEVSIAQATDRQTLALQAQAQQTSVASTAANQLRTSWNEIKNIFQEEVGERFVSGLNRIVTAFKDFLNLTNRSRTVMAELRANLDASNIGFERTMSAIQEAATSNAANIQQRIGALFLPINANITQTIQDQRANFVRLQDTFAGVSKSIIAQLNSVINGFETNMRRAESGIRDSLQRVASFADRTSSTLFEKQLAAAGHVSQLRPFDFNTAQGRTEAKNAEDLLTAQTIVTQNQTRLIQDRIATLTSQSARLFQQGDAVSIASARRKYEEIRRLIEQQGDLEETQQRRVAEFAIRQSGRTGLQSYVIDMHNREEALRSLDNRERANEESVRARLAEQQRQLERIVELERERVVEAERATRAVSSFRVTNQTGELENQFRGTPGAQRALVEIDARIATATAAMERARSQQEADIRAAQRTGAITPEQADALRRALPTQESMTAQIQAMQQLRQAIVGELNAFRNRVEAIQAQDRLVAALTSLEATIRQDGNIVREARTQQNELLVQAQRQLSGNREGLRETVRGTQVFDTAQAALTEASRAGTPENIQALVVALQSIRRLNEDEIRRGGLGPVTRGNIEQINIIAERLGQVSTRLNTADVRQFGAGQTFNEISESIRQALGQAPTTIGEAGAAADRLRLRFDQLGDGVSNLLQRLNGQIGGGPNGGEEGFAGGGLIGGSFSSQGPDNTTIKARLGEFVVNPESSKRFYATLVGINHGDAPRGGGYAHGGTVTNTIGDMHFHVNGAGNPEQTARVIMSKIRREQRRGNI